MSPRTRRPDLVIFIAALGLVVIGLVIVFSASYSTGMQRFQDPYYYIKRQLFGAVIALGVFAVVQRIDYRLLRPLALPGLALSFLLLVVVLLVGAEAGGSRAWLNVGGLRFQPAEVVKLAMVNFTAAFVAYKRDGMRRFWSGLIPPLVVLGLIFGLIMLQPDFGTGIAIVGTIVIMLFASGANLVHLAAIGLSGAPVLIGLVINRPYRLRRITSFLNPWEDPLDSGWNIIQSLLAIGSGGLFGLGLGAGRQKFAYLPEQHTDFIFSIIGEELGFFGASFVVLLFFVLAWRGFRVAIMAPDLYGSMLAVGLTSMLVFQAMLNIGVATGSLPVTGITLPFVSFGSTSLVVSLAAVGVLLNISKSARSGSS